MFVGELFLCKYYFPESKDDQMLNLTSFEIAANLLQVHWKLIFKLSS